MSESLSVGVHTLGCRLNFYESDGILGQFEKKGYKKILNTDKESPSILIINTCTVTNRADSKNRNWIRQAIRQNPTSQIWVTGCYAQTDREILEKIPGVAGVVGNENKSALVEIILGQSESSKPSDRFSYMDVLPEGHTRAYLKIQDGCNRLCSYCKIPQARGKGVSREFVDSIDQLKFLQDQGVPEIIITGVNIGWYRDENGDKAFLKLIESMVGVLDYSRIRISSIEPPDVSPALIDLMNHPRFCKFIHAPLQSGSGTILRKMRRTYTPETYLKRMKLAKEKLPGVFLGTDVILGFPGEDEKEFQETLEVCKELGIAKIHAFPYSVRKNTEAESLGDTIPSQEKKRRIHVARELSETLHSEYGSQYKGKTLEAIVENDGEMITDNYLKAVLDDPFQFHLKPGQYVDIQLMEEKKRGLWRATLP
jgi:threonylcarbamoyladenosine tRNA methylthiotransferase MtaB